MNIFTKFHEDRTKNVDFLLMANSDMCLIFFIQALYIIIKSLSFFSFTGGEQLQNIDSFPLLNRKRRNQEMAFYRPTKKHNSLFFINSSNKGKTEKFQEIKSDQGKDKYEHHQSTVGYFTLSTLLFQPSRLSVYFSVFSFLQQHFIVLSH